MSDLKPWLERILTAQTSSEVFTIVDEFRPLLWTDDDRAAMSKIYNSKVYQLNANQQSTEQIEKSNKTKSSSNISKQDAGNQRGESTSINQEFDEDDIAL